MGERFDHAAVRWRWPSGILMLLACAGLGAADAQEAPRRLLSGSEFVKRLEASAGVAWSGTPLRETLDALGRDQAIAIVLDRRVDPGQLVTLTVSQQPLKHVLTTIARHLNLGVCYVGPVVYFGPAETTQKLATVAAMRRREAERLPREAALRLARERLQGWEMLATPRDVLGELATEAGLRIADLDRFPHDLLPATSWPPLALADRLTLVLAGFGLTYQFSPDGSSLRFAPLPETAAISQTYPGKGYPRENAERIARLHPEATITVEGESIRVVGSWEAHQDVEALMQGRRVSRTVESPANKNARTVFTLQVENEPVGGVIKALAEQLKLQVTIDPRAEPRLTERISFHVADVTREELWQAVLRPAGLKARLVGDQLQIVNDD